MPCFVFTTPTLLPGDYAIPFSFSLPQNLPSSIQFYDPKPFAKPKMKVKYFVKALLKNKANKDLLKFKQVVIVREPIVHQEINI